MSYSKSLVSAKGIDGAVIGRSLVMAHTALTHLDGKPASVGLDVDISCTELRTTIGLPDRVEGNCYLREMKNLVTLRGMPKYIGKNLSISNCNNIKDLSGLTDTEIMGDMWFTEGELTSIEFYPKLVGGDMQLARHRIPRGTPKPPTVKGLLLLGYMDDGSDYEQKGKGNSDSARKMFEGDDGLNIDFDDADGIFDLDKPDDELAF